MQLFPLATCSLLAASAVHAATIHPGVHRSLQRTGTVDILISFKNGPRAALNKVDLVSMETRARDERVETVVSTLEQHAQQSQKEARDLIAMFKSASDPASSASGREANATTTMRSFWLTNQLWIAGANANMIKSVSALPSVSVIFHDELVPFTEPNMDDQIKNAVVEYGNNATIFAGKDDGSSSPVQWGVTTIRAPELWRQGITGKGIVVGSIDTGVRATHEVLARSFQGEFGWYDAVNQRADPYDDVGHGTHTVATMVGQNGYGVAPGATWMACKGCGTDGCQGSTLVACAEWMTCPTSARTGQRDCSKAPHVINNSWGGGQSLTYFSDAVDSWRKAGIIPVFSNGNNGPRCSTVSSPGDLATVISVGATDRMDMLASFSSKGPTTGTGLVKPDIAAPGKLVRSALQTADNAYGLMSGTSMAAPHVSGVVALMLCQNASLSFDEILTLLRHSAEAYSLKSTGANCGGIDERLFPNNAYGAGRMDALATLQKIVACTPAPAPIPTQAPTPAPVPVPEPSPTSTFPSIQRPFEQRLPTQQQLQLAITQALVGIMHEPEAQPESASSPVGKAVAADADAISDAIATNTLGFH